MVERYILPFHPFCGFLWNLSEAVLDGLDAELAPGIGDLAIILLWVRLAAYLKADLAHFETHFDRITVGYHRLYSHRAFHATLPIRVVLAALGAMGFQGSIKVCRQIDRI